MMAIVRALICAALVAFAAPASAQQWPTRPIRLICSTSPGQAPDIVARLFAERASHTLGQQMYVENLPAASGLLGAQTAARAAPDGYTLFLGPATVMALNMHTFKSLPYDPVRDFTPVGIVNDSGPYVFAVNPAVPAKNLGELIAYAKANPGKLTYGVATSGAFGPLIGQLFAKRAGIDIVQIPYSVNAQAISDTVAGTIQMMLTAIPSIEGNLRSGKLRALAVTSARRLPSHNDIQAVGETLPGFVVDGWFVVVAPAGTPADIVMRLNREIEAFDKDPEVLTRFATLGMGISRPLSPQETGEFIRAEQDHWGRIVNELGLKPQ
jgi:tripartite-type tricarboxylate transporter receptor subunit TctC